MLKLKHLKHQSTEHCLWALKDMDSKVQKHKLLHVVCTMSEEKRHLIFIVVSAGADRLSYFNWQCMRYTLGS